MIKADEFLNNKYLNKDLSIYTSDDGSGLGDGYGDGFGYGSGYGYCDGRGVGYGCGCGYGSGRGSGYSFGYDNGYSVGYSSGFGDVHGSGYGFGSGNGYGSCDGYGYCYCYGDDLGILKINGKEIHVIDGVQTIISHIKGNVAKGFILNDDLTMTPCYVIKGNGYFVHGKSIREARDALVEKYMRNMDIEETINEFLSKFKKGKKYKGTEFFKWHNYLTGSCLMGREAFVKNHQINLEDSFTVREFFDLCRDDYGGNIIKKLEKEWSEKYEEYN